MSYLPPIVQAFLALIVIVAAVYDYRFRRVPNWLTFSGVLIGIGLNAFLYETPGLWLGLNGVGLALLIYFPLFVLRGMGAGDVKLMAAVGAFVGPINWIGILLLTAVFGGIAAIVLVSLKGRLRQTLYNLWFILTSLGHRQAPYEGNPQLDVRSDQALRLPHGVVIACGTIVFLGAAALWAPR